MICDFISVLSLCTLCFMLLFFMLSSSDMTFVIAVPKFCCEIDVASLMLS